MLSWKDKSAEQVCDDMHDAVRVLYDSLPLGNLPPTSYTVMPDGGVSVGYTLDDLATAGLNEDKANMMTRLYGTAISRRVDISHTFSSLNEASYRFFGQPRPQLTQQFTLDLA